MGVLDKGKHEEFAQLIARGEKRGRAYVSVFGDRKGADQSASRLLKSAKVSRRIAELQAKISENLLSVSIKERNFRLDTLQNGLDRLQERRQWLNGSIDVLRAERGAALKDATPGGSTGLLTRDYKGLSGNLKEIYRVDPGLAALLSELRACEEEIRAHMEQAAREVGELQAAGTGNTAVQVNVTFVAP